MRTTAMRARRADNGAENDGTKLGETKAERFQRLAVRRTRRALKTLAMLRNCANLNTYDYTQAQANAVLSAVEAEVAKLRAAFEPKRDAEQFDL